MAHTYAGHNEWRPKQPGQRGLRILSFDGGGTRGVLSVALLKQVMERVGKDVFESFDVICGTRYKQRRTKWRRKRRRHVGMSNARGLFLTHTHPSPGHSTGGILAVLFGIEKTTISEAEALYDSLVAKIFASSPLIQTTKLLLRQSYYDEVVWEQVLQEMLGASLLLSLSLCARVPVHGPFPPNHQKLLLTPSHHPKHTTHHTPQATTS